MQDIQFPNRDRARTDGPRPLALSKLIKSLDSLQLEEVILKPDDHDHSQVCSIKRSLSQLPYAISRSRKTCHWGN